MTTETVQIVLVGGPLDGYSHPIPAAEAGVNTRIYALPHMPSIVTMWQAPDAVPEMTMTKHVHYRSMLADIGADWPVLSIADDGAMRYEYAGEW